MMSDNVDLYCKIYIPAASPRAGIMQLRDLIVAVLVWALLMLPFSAQGAFSSVEIMGDLDKLVDAGAEFIVGIDPKTGRMAVRPRAAFHRDLATDLGIAERDLIRGLIKPNDAGSWKMEMFPATLKNRFGQWQSPEFFENYLQALTRNPKTRPLINARSLAGLEVTLNESPLNTPSLRKALASSLMQPPGAPTPPTTIQPLDNKAKGDLGEQRMHELATAPKAQGGLEMKQAFDVSQSQVARQGRAGGTGFDGVFVYQDPQTGAFRWVIGESKFGQSRLGEFIDMELYDEAGGSTGRQGKFLQGSREWVLNVIARMRGGSTHDREVAKALSEALDEGRVDFMLFTMESDGQKGSFEMGRLEPGATTPRASYGGKVGRWKLKDGQPAINSMPSGGIGCSDCDLGSRFAKEAAKRKMSTDPRYAALANAGIDSKTGHMEVNPYYIVPTAEALDEQFKQDRTKALAESDKVNQALPSEHREHIQNKLARKAEAHFGQEQTKSLFDRQHFWSDLPEDGKLKVQRTRSLFDELQGDSRGLQLLQKALAAGAFAQLAWTYYEGGEQALLYALGQMITEEIEEEFYQGMAVWALTKVAMSSSQMLSTAAKRVLPVVESGGLFLVLDVAQMAGRAGYWFSTSYILGEEYDAKARQIASWFLKDVSVEVSGGLTSVNFANLCRERFPTKKSLQDRLARTPQSQYTLIPDVWDLVNRGLERSWLECKSRDILDTFFTLPEGLTRVNFCDKIDTPEKLQARLGHFRTRYPELEGSDWQIITAQVNALYKRCLGTRSAEMALQGTVNPSIPEDLQQLERHPGEMPKPTVFLLANTGAQEKLTIKVGEAARIVTPAVLWGLPGTAPTLRLVSRLEHARGHRQSLKDLHQTFQFEPQAYEPDELTHIVMLDDQVTLDEQFAEGPSTYIVELYLEGARLEERRIALNPVQTEARSATAGSQASGAHWVLESVTVFPERPDPGWSYSGAQSSSAQLTIYNGDKSAFQWTPPPQHIGSNGFIVSLSAQGMPADPRGAIAALINVSGVGLESDLPAAEWNAYARVESGPSSASKAVTLKPSPFAHELKVQVSLMWGSLGFIYKYTRAP
jgi:hypothetical protein